MSLAELAAYGITRERGFLCEYDAAPVELPSPFAEPRDVAMRLPELLPASAARHAIDALCVVSPDAVSRLGDAQTRMAMVHYSFLVQAYVWGAEDAVSFLPPSLAVPIVALADRLGQQPLLQYSGYVLDNWGKVDPAGDVSLDNIYMIQKFAGGTDEAWFVLVHVAIEAKAGEALALFGALIDAAKKAGRGRGPPPSRADCRCLDRDQCHLRSHAGTVRSLCLFPRVRPYIHGWKDNPALRDGVVYRGVARFAEAPQMFRGQTGSQSSIVPAMDALLGVGHAADPLRAYLDELHIYRPVGHRRFIDDVRAQSDLRDFVSTDRGKGLVSAYNAAVQAVADFRTRHLEYAASYIHAQGRKSAGNDTEIGTGGTPFMKYLKKHRDETKANLLEA